MLTDDDLLKIAMLLETYGLRKPEKKKAEGAAERMRRYRDRMRNASVTKRNAKRNGPHRGKRNEIVTVRNADVTACECDADATQIPLNDGTQYAVPIALVKEWETAYPICDVPQTLKEIRAWCVANPKKLKTRWGVTRFINSWMARIQDKG
jgi:hypothetical protein